jgi:hypothetical protein
LNFSIFEPRKTRPKKFQSENFCDFQLSRQKFSGPKYFTAKKRLGFRFSWPGSRTRIYDGSKLILQIVSVFPNFRAGYFLIFQISTENFFGFSNFEPKKNPVVPTFGPEIFGRKNFRTVRVGHDRPDQYPKVCGISVVRPATKGDIPGFRGDLFEIFGRESSYSAKISGTLRVLKF